MKNIDIAEELGLGRSVVGKITVKLKDSGLVERTNDRKNLRVQLTKLGLAEIGDTVTVYESLERKDELIKIGQKNSMVERRMAIIGYIQFNFDAYRISQIIKKNIGVIYRELKILKQLGYLTDYNDITDLGLETFDNYVMDYEEGKKYETV